MDTQTGMPPIDRNAEEALVASTAMQPQAAAPGTPPPPADVALPSVENAPPMMFRPVAGITAADMVEITLMYLLQLSGAQVQVEKGALRSQALSALRCGQLSDEALKHMQAMVDTVASPPGVPPAPPARG